MDALITITVADFDHLTLLLKAVSAHAEVLTLTIQSMNSTDGSVRARLPRPVQFGLTPMEWQMIEFAVQGATRRHIATQLNLAPSSISTYWARIYDKLGFRSRSALIAWYRTEVIGVQEAEVEATDSRAVAE